MKLAIRTRHLLLSPEALAELRRRVTVAFARLDPWVRTVDITVEDTNGPKGGPASRSGCASAVARSRAS